MAAGTIHEDLTRDRRHDGPSHRSFGIVFSVFFAVVAIWPLRTGEPVRLWSLGLGAAFSICALIVPGALAPLNRIWTKFGLVLSRIARPVAMGVLFYGVITPLGFFLRLKGNDPLRMLRTSSETYWIERQPPGPAAETMTDQF
jgi:hypothetical protein